MDVSSVNKPNVQHANAPKRVAENQKPPVRDSKPPENETRKAEQTAAKPVVNTQGQITGRHLNVTA
ncbi:MAG: hypothetical protein Q7T69_20550 [Rhodoferax sp.]|nr:hypothetical protein [Rhodoferax sp.]